MGGLVPPRFRKSASLILKDFDVDDKGWLNQAEFEKLGKELFEGMEKTREPTWGELMRELRTVDAEVEAIQHKLKLDAGTGTGNQTLPKSLPKIEGDNGQVAVPGLMAEDL